MSDNNKTYRIHTEIGNNTTMHVNINQDYETFSFLTLKMRTDGVYKLHTSNYGCVAGRVLANEAFGIPNAKVSVFIPNNNETSNVINALYPYRNVTDKDSNSIRYNTLPEDAQFDCHQPVGTFPDKRTILDNNDVLEVYEKYYKYTTVTNESGDYMLFGVPTGNQIIHIDIDLSDIGILSQTPRDLMAQGFNKDQFESSVKFKTSTNLDYLPQIISQTFSVNVVPFWGEESETEKIGITRNDMNIAYKFETNCIFMGSIIYDNPNNSISKNCIPKVKTGLMREIETGPGRIEMIRKTPNDEVEYFTIQGNQLIDGSGTWCYQIPMNLDYMGMDEYGNLVPTNDSSKGIATRARVRFRISSSQPDNDMSQNRSLKILVPNNPIGSEMYDDKTKQYYGDYNFGSLTEDDEFGGKSFRDLFYNNVYTVKQYIPRLQKGSAINSEKFTGIKLIESGGTNNPLPYNNMRVKISFVFVLQCMILKIMVLMITVYNKYVVRLRDLFASCDSNNRNAGDEYDKVSQCMLIGGDVCPQMQRYFFAPGCQGKYIGNTAFGIYSKEENSGVDTKSVDGQNEDIMTGRRYLLTSINEIMKCIEITLAMEYNVIKFDFYNDWLNGVLYFPKWQVTYKKKRSFLLGLIKIPAKLSGCVDGASNITNNLKYVQQCSLKYRIKNKENIDNRTEVGCVDGNINKQKCHKASGLTSTSEKDIKIVKNAVTLDKKDIYYLRSVVNNVPLFQTDIVLLGSLNNNGNIFKVLDNSSFVLPSNMALTNLDDDTVEYKTENSDSAFTDEYEDKISGKTIRMWSIFYPKGENAHNSGLINKENEDSFIVEESGIDWGYYPKVGVDNVRNLYFPGGHFVGMSCTNSEVNIKSCVNLSRICELGTTLSTRKVNYKFVKDSEGNIHEEVLNTKEATGLISDASINNIETRTIFATLNANHLRTIVDEETGFRYYDFIPLYPNGFDGILKNEIGAETTAQGDRENKKNDYIRFRYGLMVKNGNINSKTWIERNGDISYKFLKNEDDIIYQLPIYDNSFYFYFGLSRTVTALTRFIEEYYSECDKEAKNHEVLSKPLNDIILNHE